MIKMEEPMAYDEAVAGRVRRAVGKIGRITEMKMFGGVAFLIRGNMCCGVIGDRLMVRVGAEEYEDALSQPHARKMDFTGRPMKGFVYVEPAGFSSDKDLDKWVARAGKYVLTLPPK